MPHHLMRAHHREHPLVQLLRHPHRHGSPDVLRMLEPHGQRPRLQSPRYGGGGRRHGGVPRQRRRVEIELPYQLLNRRLHGRCGHGRPLRRASTALLLARHLLNPAATGSKRLRLRPPVTPTQTQYFKKKKTQTQFAAAAAGSRPPAPDRRGRRPRSRVRGGGARHELRRGFAAEGNGGFRESWGGGLVDFPSLPPCCSRLDCPALLSLSCHLSLPPFSLPLFPFEIKFIFYGRIREATLHPTAEARLGSILRLEFIDVGLLGRSPFDSTGSESFPARGLPSDM